MIPDVASLTGSRCASNAEVGKVNYAPSRRHEVHNQSERKQLVGEKRQVHATSVSHILLTLLLSLSTSM